MVHLTEVLKHYIDRSGYTAGQVAKLSGVPKMTIVNWLEGRVRKPRHWGDLVKVANVIHLDQTEADEILNVAGYPTITELLLQSHSNDDRRLLLPWEQSSRSLAKPAPFQVIADLPYFVGRERELYELKQALLSGRRVMMCSLQGMGGAGKTTLAARVAYELRAHFQDGILWARMDTTDVMTTLSTFANAYGREVSQYTDLDSRSRVVRDLLASKRALLILDNAQNSEDLLPLIPPTDRCAVLITTRRHDLSITSGTYRFTLGTFNEGGREAFDLFAKILGSDRASADRAALIELASLLGQLPLAVAITAGRLAYEPDWSVQDFLQRVRQRTRRLNELAYGDQNVRRVISLSVNALSPLQRHVFAALGVFESRNFSVAAAAYIADIEVETTHDVLRDLYMLSLIQQAQAGHYRQHPLISDLAKEQPDQDLFSQRLVAYSIEYLETHASNYVALETEIGNLYAALEIALQRGMHAALVSGIKVLYHFLEVRGLYTRAQYYLRHAQQSAQKLNDTPELAAILCCLGRVELHCGHYAQAEAYLTEGWRLASQTDCIDIMSALLESLGVLAEKRGDYVMAQRHFEEGLDMTRSLQDIKRTCVLLTNLATIFLKCGDHKRAQALYLEGLNLAREIHYQEGVSIIFMNLGVMAARQGNYAVAETHFLEGLSVVQVLGYREKTCAFLQNLGGIASKRGSCTQAQMYFQESLQLARELGHRERMCGLLTNLGVVADQQGDTTQAEAYYLEGLTLAREMGHREIVATSLVSLATIALKRGGLDQAETYLHEGLAVAKEMGHRWLLASALNQRGTLYLKQRETAQAADAFLTSLQIAREIEAQEFEANALYGLAQVAYARGDAAEACRHGQASLEILQAMGHHTTAEVVEWLAQLTSS